ncbi:hypothetical protein SKAU_G00168600 [Synaphobranchus kaupii]|uniref:MULE transposase domain-containing protein n=1 Tax=Synaphobranchus kaupii TaxID=118154 RepID=A0A9Q1FKJ5_SYNKA|nr:hypothetical protein SKAU_G00168600 [Synaphobranchus kaupii]
MEDFITYVRNTYIRPGSTFPAALWNVFERGMDQRTNNHIESYHRTLNDAVQVRHPSLWLFIRRLKDRQTLTEERTTMAERGEAPPPRRRKWRDLETQLLRLKGQYNDGNRNIESYWRAVSKEGLNSLVWALVGAAVMELCFGQDSPSRRFSLRG